jgi:nucleoside-diphosphate-sugar epimerase
MPPTTRILLLGGHGKVSLFMTPKLVARSWNVTSVIRNPDQTKAILEAGKNGPGKVDVLVESLEDVKSTADAQRILDKAKPDWVVWSAGMSFCCDRLKLVLYIYAMSLSLDFISKLIPCRGWR